ncbi:hypothetical protein [Pantoea sp. BAV 3049]|uniref:hypothetical protein n=1 Tax=Pantoea sp. BAV 3049 TaxID=2654188 RepID=UPI00131BF549|nr:hypothetical protein [Pantoea sp. BAV 3049]
MSVKIQDKRINFDRLKRELEKSGGKEVVAGIQQGAVNDGLQVAQYATWNEFGAVIKAHTRDVTIYRKINSKGGFSSRATKNLNVAGTEFKRVSGARFTRKEKSNYATTHTVNFGQRTIPSRPFMRTYFEENINTLEKVMQNGVRAVVTGRSTITQALNAAGVRMVDGIKKSIRNGNWEANSQATIRRKKSAKPLIDSGVMLNSVTFAIHDYGTTKE